MKRTFSNIDCYAITRELDQFLSKGNISNIYEVEDLLIFKINTPKGNRNLIIKKDSRINLTHYDYPIPKYPSQYIQSLRKKIRNKRILGIHQYNFDRIIVIELGNNGAEPWKFIIELFNKGNYILVNGNDIVIIAKRYLKLKDRNILANKKYSFPQSYGENFLEITMDQFNSIINEDEEIVRILARKINIAGTYSEEICYRANLDKTIIGSKLHENKIENLYKSFKNLRNDLMFSDINAHIVYDDKDNQISVLPFELEIYKDFTKKNYPSFNRAVDEYFSRIDSENVIESSNGKFKEKIASQEKILKNQLEYINTLKEKSEQYYSYGDFIYANFKSLERLLKVIRDAKSKGYTWEDIEEKLQDAKREGMDGTEYFDRIVPSTSEVVLKVDESEIYLDIYKSIGENASIIYSRGKKSKDKIVGTKKAIEKTKSKINKLQQERDILEEKIDFLVKKPEKKWYEKYRWFESSDDYLVIGGRDASSNEAIFRKYIEPNDLILHTNFPGSPLAIIKNPQNNKIPEQSLREAAAFVASYSQAWKENWGVVDVFYVNPEQVSKSPPSGEYLPKGSFMIEGKKNFIRNAKTELAIGIVFEKIKINTEEYDYISYPKIIAGPIKPIKNKANKYVKIKPSRTGISKGNLARKIKNIFLKKSEKDQRKWIDLLSLDDLILMLPNGYSKIINSKENSF
ncbi:MAG: ribosome rescue protein RqcH [Promethearchaeati archaeon]